jgi:hypothetical protein
VIPNTHRRGEELELLFALVKPQLAQIAKWPGRIARNNKI